LNNAENYLVTFSNLLTNAIFGLIVSIRVKSKSAQILMEFKGVFLS